MEFTFFCQRLLLSKTKKHTVLCLLGSTAPTYGCMRIRGILDGKVLEDRPALSLWAGLRQDALLPVKCPLYKNRLWQCSNQLHLIKKVLEGNWGASLVAQLVKNPPANAGETRDVSLIPGLGRAPGEGNGNPLKYSCLKNPRTEEPGWIQSKGLQRVRHNWASMHTTYWNFWLQPNIRPFPVHDNATTFSKEKLTCKRSNFTVLYLCITCQRL